MSSSRKFQFLMILFFLTIFSVLAHAEMGIPVQLRLKDNLGSYPTESGVAIKLQVLTPAGGCILREEIFSGQTITNGNISLVLGAGTAGTYDPGISLNSVYDNSRSKTGLTCVNSSNAITGTGQTYNPTSIDQRLIRFTATVTGVPLVVDFNMKSIPYAIQAESVGGKLAADIIVNNATSQLNQTNLNNLLLDATRLSNLIDVAQNGNAQTATTATNFTGSLVGDVTGTQAATVVARLRGVNISATAPTSGQILVYNGSQYSPANQAAAAVTSVAGRTGAVTLTTADIGGLGTAATQNTGVASGNVVQLDSAGKIPSSTLPNNVLTTSATLAGDVSGNLTANTVNTVGGKTSSAISQSVDDTLAATNSATAGTLVKRDGSGNASLNTVTSLNNSTQNIYLYNVSNTNNVRVRAPVTFSDYVLTLPTTDGFASQVLQTDGAGNLDWLTIPTTGVQSVSATSPLVATGTTNVSLSINVGTTSGTVAAGNDTRIANALQTSTIFAGDVSGTYNTLALVNSGVAASTYTKVVVDAKGRVTSGTLLTASDIPSLDTAKITSGAFSVARGGTGLSAVGTANQVLGVNAAATGLEYKTITAGTNITVSNTAGVLTISASNPGGTVTNVSSGNSYTTITNNTTAPVVTVNVGTTANTVAAGDDSRIANALQFSTIFAGDVSGTATATTVSKILGTTVSVTALAANNILQYNGTNYVNRSIPTCPMNEFLTFNGSAWSCAPVTGLGGGTVTNVSSGNSYLSVLNGTTTPVLTINTGSVSGTVAAGDDTRIANALQPSTVFSGDVSGTYNSIVLNNSGVAASTYSKVTVDSKGRVTSGTSINSGDVTGALGYTPANAASSGATTLAGDVTGTASANVVSLVGGKTSAQVSQSVSDTLAATSLNSVSTIVKRNGSGGFNASSGVFESNVQVKDGAAGGAVTLQTPVGFTSYALTFPVNDGNPNQVLQTDGSGILSWVTGGAGTVTNVSSANSYISIATSATTPVITANIGTTSGTLAAGNDSRIANALQPSTVFAGDVSGTYNNTVLSNSGVVASTYTKVVVDAKGRVTSGTLLTASDIPSLDTAKITSGSFSVAHGGTGLSAVGTANQVLGVNAAATGLEYKTITAGSNITVSNTAGVLTISSSNPGGTVTNVSSSNSYITVATSSTTPSLTLNVGTASGTVAAGNDSRILNALQFSTIFAGDVSGTYNSIVLANSGVAASTYSKVTVDSKGRVTSGSSINSGDVTSALGYTPANVASAGTVTNVTSGNSYTTVTNNSTTPVVTVNVGTAANTLAAGNDSRILNALQFSTVFSGDVSGTYNSIVLNNSGVAASTYSKVTVDAKGRVTSGTSINATDVNSALGYTAANAASAGATTLAGDVTGTAAANVVSLVGGKTSAQVSQSVSDTLAATSLNSVSTIVKRNGSGGFNASSGVFESNVQVKDGAAGGAVTLQTPVGFTSYALTFPVNDGNPNQVLQTDGSGILSWVTDAAGSVTNVSSANTYLTVTSSATTPVITANVGTASGTLAAGDDSRILNALQFSTVFSGDVSGTYNSIVLNNSGVAASTYTKVVVDAKGRVTSGTSLVANDIPSLDTAKITSGSFSVARGGTGLSALGISNQLLGVNAAATGLEYKTVSAGANITVSNTAGVLTISSSNPGGTVTNVTATAPLSVSNGTTTPALSISQANTTTAGFLTAADWNLFNSKLSTLDLGSVSATGTLAVARLPMFGGDVSSVSGSNVLTVATVGGKTSAQISQSVSDTLAATAANTINTIVKRNGSGAFNASSGVFESNVQVKDGAAGGAVTLQTPVGFTSYALTFPSTDGDPLQLLQTNGSGILSWVSGGIGTVTNVTSGNLYTTVTAGASVPVITVNVGTVSNTLAAGNDSRIVNALQFSTVFTGDVSGTASTTVVTKIQGVSVSSGAPVTGQALVYNGTTWEPTTGFPQFAKLTADASNTNGTTLANVTGLSFPVVSGRTYKFRFNIVFSTSATTRGLRTTLTTPTFTVLAARAEIPTNVADGTDNRFTGQVTSSGDIVVATTAPGGNNMAFIEGTIVPSASGTVQLQSAQSGGGTSTVRAGSSVEFTELP